jgi:N-acetylglucosaminylphosphatidylinositol deacetylase
MTATWDKNKISDLLSAAFAPHLAKQKANDNSAPTAAIDVLITFDANGVSSHPNHISLYHGAKQFVATLMKGKPGWASPVDIYTLTSVSILRKYTGFLDVFATMAMSFGTSKTDKKHPAGLVFANQLVGAGGLSTAWTAMTTAHKSQMVWFRYGWITFSRYMVLNDLKLEKMAGTRGKRVSEGIPDAVNRASEGQPDAPRR